MRVPPLTTWPLAVLPGRCAREWARDDLARQRQLLCLAELCNARGNCDTFCPEDGAPFAVKPRLFLDRARFAAAGGAAFLVVPAPPDAGSPFAVTAAAVCPCARRI